MDKLSNNERAAIAQKAKFVYSNFFSLLYDYDEKYLRKRGVIDDAIIQFVYKHLTDRLMEKPTGIAVLDHRAYHNCDTGFIFMADKIAKLGKQGRQDEITAIFEDPASTTEIKELCIAQMDDFEKLSSILRRYDNHYISVAVLLNQNFLFGPKDEVARILKDLTSGPRKTQAFYVQLALASLYLDKNTLGELIEDPAVELQREILYHNYDYDVIKWLSENSKELEIKLVASSKLSQMSNIMRKYDKD
ncbi:MAG: hypothetical protein LVQ97_02510 [Candidatus Micrarchaeales archaeon]|jgi:hypothetical protein|uniref:Uncharacterized protein n=1 Tax=Candidatus Micrarchaeum acidiphilum ARMAN-2 TaxID=425595 RepID=C7DIK4_MICA2|nr:MAG: hypothetical protein UNLARM2_0893 [Candidatus Micrarchaeum acidiphilum ARMAN-2]MCW6161033.1 hypothetical protein [Candidatus Micrarchaeales archaeon]